MFMPVLAMTVYNSLLKDSNVVMSGKERKKEKKKRYLMLYTQSTAKGYIRVKQNIFLPQVKC